jgi:hypothetical protein
MTFHFVTENFHAAYSAARQAPGNNGVDIAGGASTIRQALTAGMIDELTLAIAPILLDLGEFVRQEHGRHGHLFDVVTDRQPATCHQGRHRAGCAKGPDVRDSRAGSPVRLAAGQDIRVARPEWAADVVGEG